MTQIKKIYWILIISAFSYLNAFAADPPPVGGDPTGSGGTPIGGGAPLTDGYVILICIVLLYGFYKYYASAKKSILKINI